MSDLRERLDRELARVVPARDARAAVDTRVARRRRRRTVLLPTVTLVLTAGLVAGLTLAFRPVPPPGPADAASIPMPGEPFQAIVYGDALWTLTTEPGCDGPSCPGFVVKVDTQNGEVTGQVAVTSPTGLTAGAGSIWLASFADATLIRLDPDNASVEATIPLVLPGEEQGSDWRFLPTHVDASEDGVWVSTARGAVAHIDPATNRVVDVVPLPPEGPGGVAIGREAVWIDNSLGGLLRVDPEDHHVEEVRTIDDEVGRRLFLGTPVARGGTLWLVGNWARPVDELGETYYEATERQALVEIDEMTGEVASILDLPKDATWASLLDDGDVWLVESDGAFLRRLDPLTGDLAEPIPVPFGRPLVVSGTLVWSAVGTSIRSWELLDVSSDPPDARDDEPAIPLPVNQIAFSSYRDDRLMDIYLMNTDGTGVTRLTDSGAEDLLPAWSPDGSRIAFSSTRSVGPPHTDGHIFIMNADGTGQRRLVFGLSSAGSPAWSPDGTKIAFAGCCRPGWDIYVINEDGTGLVQLTSDELFDSSPDWSPDGSHIVFGKDDDGTGPKLPSHGLYVISADGTGLRQLTRGDGAQPAWSPSGAGIAFARFGDRRGIYLIDPRSGEEIRLTSGEDTEPAWSPGGTRIAFTSFRVNGEGDIFVMESDGSHQIQITDNPFGDYEAAWQPPPNGSPTSTASASP